MSSTGPMRLLWGVCLVAATAVAQVKLETGDDQVRIGNERVALALAVTGGSATTLTAPPGRQDWLAGSGLELHLVEQYTEDNSDYAKAKYRVETVQNTAAEAVVELSAAGKQGNWGFCTVKKRFRCEAGAPAVTADLRFYVGGGAVIRQFPSFMFIQTAPVDATVLIPGEKEGIIAVTQENKEPVMAAPAQGWVAVRKGSSGLVYVLPMADLKYIGVRKAGQTLKLAWRTVGYGLDPEQEAVWPLTLIAYEGLETVDGAGDLGCGQLTPGGEVRFFSLAVGEGTLTLASRQAGQDWAVGPAQPVALQKGLNQFGTGAALAAGKQYRARLVCGERTVDLYRTTADGPVALPLATERREEVAAPLAAGKDIDYKDYLETPHVKWAKPLVGGRLKVFAVWGELSGNRMICELDERLDAEIDTVTLASGSSVGWGLGGPLYGSRGRNDITRALDACLTKRQYDVIVIGGDFNFADQFGEDLGGKLADAVRRGTGLVYGNVAVPTASLNALLPLKRAFNYGGSGWTLKDASYCPITAGIPIAQMSSGIKKYIGVKPEGKLWVSAGIDGEGKSATENPLLVTSQFEKGRVAAVTGLPGGEEGMAFLVKAVLWAARRDPAIRLTKVQVDQAAYDYGQTPRLTLTAERANGANANCTVTVTCGDWQEQKPLTFDAAGRAELTMPLGIRPAVGPGRADVWLDLARARANFGFAKFTVKPVGELNLRLAREGDWQVYNYGDPIAGTCPPVGQYETVVELVDGVGRVLARQAAGAGPFALATAAAERQTAYVRATVRDQGRVIQTRQVPVGITLKPVNRTWNEYEMHLFGAGAGMRGQLERDAMDPWCYGGGLDRDLKRLGVTGVPYGIAEVDAGAWESLLRDYGRTKDPRLLHRVPCINSANFRQMVKEMCARVQDVAKLGTIAYINGDEQSMTSYTREFDFCFSPDCMAEFRRYLQQKYGTIGELNQVWETQYPDFNAATPPLTPDVRKNAKLIPAWNDFRIFNNITFAKGYSLIRDEVRKYDPNARLGICGTQADAAFGGHDYYRLMKVFDCLQEYGFCDEFQRAMNPNARLAPCSGYSVDYIGMKNGLWRGLVMGYAGSSYYDEQSGVWPTLRLAPGLVAAGEVVTLMKRTGVGRLLVTASKQYDPIAAYYSHESINAGFIRYGGGNQAAEMMGWYRQAQPQTSFCPTFVTRTELLAGLPGLKCVVMVGALAVGDDELAALAKFQAAGGLVFADDRLGTVDFNCRPRTDKTALDQVRQHANFVNLKTAKAPADWAQLWRERLHLVPRSDFRAAAGALGAATGTYQTGDLIYSAVHNGSGKPREFVLTLPAKAFVYEARSGQFLGEGPEIKVTVAPYEAAVLARLPYRVTGVEVTAPATIARGENLAITAQVAATAKPQAHLFACVATDPQGKVLLTDHWRVPAPEGKAETRFFVPFNAAPGDWQLEVREAATGTTKKLKFSVK